MRDHNNYYQIMTNNHMSHGVSDNFSDQPKQGIEIKDRHNYQFITGLLSINKAYHVQVLPCADKSLTLRIAVRYHEARS